MHIIDFYKKEKTTSGIDILVMACTSGLSNGSLLAIITFAAKAVSRDSEGGSFRYLILFIISLLSFIMGKRYALKHATIVIEGLIKKVRTRITNKIRQSELLFFENIEKSHIYTRINQDTNFISQSALLIINSCQSALILVFCLFYIAWLSKLAFFITVGAIIAAVIIYLMYRKEVNHLLQGITDKETELFESLTHIVDGFKELKVNRRKSDHVFTHFKDISDSTEKIKVKAGIAFITDFVYSQTFFYILIAILVFLLPIFVDTYSEVIIKLVMAVLFIIGPVEMVVGVIPVLARANVAVGNLYKLEELLDKEGGIIPQTEQAPFQPIESFREIRIDKVTFNYKDKDEKVLFHLGPIDLSIKSGEIVFLVGGNGCGKSTLLKLLSGLYYPSSGALYLDDDVLSKPIYPSYRELFSLIFADFHIFDRLYGFGEVDTKKVNDLIKLMELDKKTQYVDGKFTETNLSTGQRKRLALIAAFLEDKPIYMFDEVAADQDPEFRAYFYNELLLDLKKRGKTVIAATHDDKYFHVADRVLKMEYGKIQSI
ncbi:MAG: cyclic peptide export ABC transporter [Candidatus Scalindua sp.]|jgi:putative ATP-binding cassette transporter|nr:cyclic peptide export ABC transporter [Candidatus Scalindua sp.]MBT7212680.1 cyclic peptide export ABC transporter [Candidatus Scalindua sp.]